MIQIADNVAAVQEKIAQAAARAGRSADEITLVAVSKQKPIEALVAAYEAGMRAFGENRSAELAQKSAELAHLPNIDWHFIGQRQTRQSQPIATHAQTFHAVDRVKIASRLSRQLEPLERTLPVFIEVNVSGEDSKGGFSAGNWEQDSAQREQLAATLATIAELPRIEIKGLMTMAAYGAPEAEIRTVFQRTRGLAEWLATAVPQAEWSQLSMGMTDDYHIAIEEGATHVRVGRAIFGERNYNR